MAAEFSSRTVVTHPPAAIGAMRAPLPRPVVMKLRDQLLAQSLLTAGQFLAAVRYADAQRVPLPDALVALSYVPEQATYAALSVAAGMPLIDLEATQVSPLAIRLVPERVARRHRALPLAEDNRTLTYATSHPFAAETDQDVSFASGRQAHPLLARPSQLAAAIDRFYPRLSNVERLLARFRTQVQAASQTMRDAAMRLVDQGVTSTEEVDRVLSDIETPAAAPATSKKRVLVVDDDRMIRMLVRMLLQREGYEVLEAQDGHEGIDKVLAERADLLITDLIMPEFDGYKTLAALRAEGSCTLLPVIVLTAEAGSEVEKTVLSLGADDYIIKPFDADMLINRVRSVFVRRPRIAS